MAVWRKARWEQSVARAEARRYNLNERLAAGLLQMQRAVTIESIFCCSRDPLHSDDDIEALVTALSDVWSRLILRRAA